MVSTIVGRETARCKSYFLVPLDQLEYKLKPQGVLNSNPVIHYKN